MNTKQDADSQAVAGQVERTVRPLSDRLRDSVEWLERDGFATSAGLAREAAAEIERLRAIASEAAAAAVDFQREILAVRRYCDDVRQTGSVNEQIVAQTVSRMLARPPAA
jgi:hypothetical protein